jgi:hypothetical protein
MSFTTNFDQSNRADWIIDISATDATPGDTFGDDIDFTGASVQFAVYDENRCQKLSATIGSGITLVGTTVLEVAFTESQMNTLCPGTYNIGCAYQLAGVTSQLLTGSVSIYEGWANL